VHIRPHPARDDPWLPELVEAIKARDVPCRLTTAELPITEAARQYPIVSAVSASMRDVCLGCPEAFVVGSVGDIADAIPRPEIGNRLR
jgi:hypothetical protein